MALSKPVSYEVSVFFRNIAVVVFTLCLAVHVVSFFPGCLRYLLWSYVLHLVVILLNGVMVICALIDLNVQIRPGSGGLFARWTRDEQKAYQDFASRWWRQLPIWVYVCAISLLLYLFTTMLLFDSSLNDGQPAFERGKYFLERHGRQIREIAQDEFFRYQARNIRIFSGSWIVFAYIATTYFHLTTRKKFEQLQRGQSHLPPVGNLP